MPSLIANRFQPITATINHAVRSSVGEPVYHLLRGADGQVIETVAVEIAIY